ncbi:hypothetical protein [Escherichia phage BEK6]|nr:hypothetical protein [Escherichia phage BEK6]
MKRGWVLVVNGKVIGYFETEDAAWLYCATHCVGEFKCESIEVTNSTNC